MTRQSELPIADGAQSWRCLLLALAPQRGRLLAAATLMLASSACALMIPAVLGRIVDLVLGGADGMMVLAAAGVIGLAGAVAGLMQRLGGGMLVSGLQHALADLREEVLESALHLDQAVLEDAGSADVISRVTADVEAVSDAVGDVLPRFLNASFAIALTFIGLVALDPRLAVAALIAVPVQILTTVRFLRSSRPLYRRLRRQEAERGQALIESVHGAPTIVALRDQDRHLHLISQRSLTAVETVRSATRARNRFNAGLNLAEFLGLSAVLGMGFWLSLSTGLSIGSVTAAALFFHRLFDPIGTLLASIDDLQRAAAGLGRLVGVTLARPAPLQREQPVDASISIRGVRHCYQHTHTDALQDVCLQLPAGSTTVFVGSSGSGKSTLAAIIAGVMIPGAGSVRIGGIDAHLAGDEQPAALLVAQETHRFIGSVAENLRLAAPDADDALLVSALTEVGATWITDLPHGLGTVLDDTSATVGSFDEAMLQQIALARVLLADPPVVILDEATAHGGTLDLLDAGVAAVIRDRTAVVVAHRFAQARIADQIVVFDRGRIVEQGNHSELVSAAGRYAALNAAAGAR